MIADENAADRERLNHTRLKAHRERLTAELEEDAENRRPPLDPVPRGPERYELREPRWFDLLSIEMFVAGLFAAGLFGMLVGYWAR